MGLFAVVGAAAEAVATVVHGRVAHEAVLQRLVALLVPLEVADHLLLLHEDARVAVQTVEVLPGGEKKRKRNEKNLKKPPSTANAIYWKVGVLNERSLGISNLSSNGTIVHT